MWMDVHGEVARQRHADRLNEAARARLAWQHRQRRVLRLRLGRLHVAWHRVAPRTARETG
jgi:hypothetical protein